MLQIPLMNDSNVMLDVNCTMNIIHTAKFLRNQLHAQLAQENKFGADMYAVTIIGAFASVIVLLMFRSIRPHQSLDEQVTLMMSTMKMRVEVDEYERRKMKMREAKKKAQDWINSVKKRSMRSLSRSSKRSKSSMDTPPSIPEKPHKNGNCLKVPYSMSQQNITVDDETKENHSHSVSQSNRQSVCSAPTPHLLEVNLPVRSNSHLGFVPEIVVTEERPKLCLLLPPPTRRRNSAANPPSTTTVHKSSSCQQFLLSSRKSSMSSNISVSPSLSEEIVFNFPESGTATPNDSPPYDI